MMPQIPLINNVVVYSRYWYKYWTILLSAQVRVLGIPSCSKMLQISFPFQLLQSSSFLFLPSPSLSPSPNSNYNSSAKCLSSGLPDMLGFVIW